MAEVMRDFRIDEEYGMESDPNLEKMGTYEAKISLADTLNQQKAIFNRSPTKDVRSSIDSGIKNDTLMLQRIDQDYPEQDAAKQWLIGIVRPFMLNLLSEPKYNYMTLVDSTTGDMTFSQTFNQSTYVDRTLSKETLMKKFELRVRHLLQCF